MQPDSDASNVEHDTPHPRPFVRDPILALVASTDVHLDAWTAKWLLQSEGIQAFLGGHAVAPAMRVTDIYVLADDLVTAKQILERTNLWHASTWVTSPHAS
jgi:hypothetical protein